MIITFLCFEQKTEPRWWQWTCGSGEEGTILLYFLGVGVILLLIPQTFLWEKSSGRFPNSCDQRFYTFLKEKPDKWRVTTNQAINAVSQCFNNVQKTEDEEIHVVQYPWQQVRLIPTFIIVGGVFYKEMEVRTVSQRHDGIPTHTDSLKRATGSRDDEKENF